MNKPTGAGDLSRRRPLFTLGGACSGPTLAVFGRAGDLAATAQKMRSSGDFSGIAGLIEFHLLPFSGRQSRQNLIVLHDDPDGSKTSVSNCHRTVVERATELGMFASARPALHAQHAHLSETRARRTDEGWKLRRW